MKLRKAKFKTSIALITFVLMAVFFVNAPISTSGKKDALTIFIEKKLSKKMSDTRLSEIQWVAKSITDGAKTTTLDPLLILALVEHESQYRADALGRHGEIGLLQVRPKTAKWVLKRHNKIWSGKDMLLDPTNNVQIGILYLSWLRKKFNDTQTILAAYNMGASATKKFLKKNIIPKIYSDKVFAKYQNLLLEYETYQLSLNPKAASGQLSASN